MLERLQSRLTNHFSSTVADREFSTVSTTPSQPPRRLQSVTDYLVVLTIVMIVSLVSTVCQYNIAQLIITPQLTIFKEFSTYDI